MADLSVMLANLTSKQTNKQTKTKQQQQQQKQKS